MALELGDDLVALARADGGGGIRAMLEALRDGLQRETGAWVPVLALRAGALPASGWLLLATLARANVTIFNYRLQLNFDPAWSALAESYFLLGNWNLLWYAAIGGVLH